MRKLAFTFYSVRHRRKTGQGHLLDQRKLQPLVSRTAPPPPTQPQHIELQAWVWTNSNSSRSIAYDPQSMSESSASLLVVAFQKLILNYWCLVGFSLALVQKRPCSTFNVQPYSAKDKIASESVHKLCQKKKAILILATLNSSVFTEQHGAAGSARGP